MSESTKEAKADLRSLIGEPSFRGALTCDHHVRDDDPEHLLVPTDLVGDISRAADAVRTISRLVYNSLNEPDMSGTEPLGHSAHLGLLNGLELIGKYLEEVKDRMLETGSLYVEFQREQADREARHG